MTEEMDLQSLVQRLERVERQNRNLKRLGYVAVVVLGAILFLAQVPGHRTVEAQSFILKDASGQVRAELSTDAQNTPALILRDDKGNARVSVGGGDKPFLTLSNADNQQRVQLFVLPDVYGMTLYSGQVNRVSVGVWNGVPALTVYDQSQKVVWSTGIPAP